MASAVVSLAGGVAVGRCFVAAATELPVHNKLDTSSHHHAGSVCVRRWNKEGLVDLQSGSGRKCQERRRSSRKRPCGAIQVTNVATPIKPPATESKTITSKDTQRPIFPFTAIVGQEEMKLCLILNVIDPKIGGVMIMGDRGTGKSTTVRALVDLLPEIKVVAGDPFNSDPEDPELMSEEIRLRVEDNQELPVVSTKINMVDLPLGATEDRVCGTIDIEKALTEGVRAFEPGLLAKANRGILYVDEVNLLDDHLVDVLLDAAASGWNTVEREGISISHPARFILIGSGDRKSVV